MMILEPITRLVPHLVQHKLYKLVLESIELTVCNLTFTSPDKVIGLLRGQEMSSA